MSLNDEIAIFSDPIHIQNYDPDADFASLFLDQLNHQVNSTSFFDNQNQSTKKEQHDQNLHIFDIQQDQNCQICSGNNSFGSMIDMPSGEIFEVLAQEYQFHLNNRKVINSEIHQKITGLNNAKSECEILCHYNAEIAQ
jgi:hypothetical protein